MTTQKQAAANRQNAQNSTGARTPEGKEASAQNSRKWGFYQKSDLLPWEDEAEYNEHREGIIEWLQPEDSREWFLAKRIISLEWRLLRVPHAEAEIYQCYADDEDTEKRSNELRILSNNEKRMEGSLRQCRREWEEYQEAKRLWEVAQERAARQRAREEHAAASETCNAHGAYQAQAAQKARDAEWAEVKEAVNEVGRKMKAEAQWERDELERLKHERSMQQTHPVDSPADTPEAAEKPEVKTDVPQGVEVEMGSFYTPPFPPHSPAADPGETEPMHPLDPRFKG